MIVLSKGDNTASCTECNATISIPVPLTIPAFRKWVEFQEEFHKTCTKRPKPKEQEEAP